MRMGKRATFGALAFWVILANAVTAQAQAPAAKQEETKASTGRGAGDAKDPNIKNPSESNKPNKKTPALRKKEAPPHAKAIARFTSTTEPRGLSNLCRWNLPGRG